MKKNLSIYIHIPFCVKKCLYCDFPSFTGLDVYYQDYINSLCAEIIEASLDYTDREVKTVFIGGGTPTILNTTLIGKIIDTLISKYNVSNDAEITIESNPGTLDRAKLNDLKNMYFNRISIGLQAWQNKHLARLGRIHTSQQFESNYIDAREVGFKNINVDVMFSLPNQTIDEWNETLNRVVLLNPEHISAYSLIVEEGTPFYKMSQDGVIKELNEEIDRNMYYSTNEILSKNGYHRYEISNYAKKGFECEHNKVYWRTEEYRGFGLGSHSYVNGIRFHNVYDFESYLKSKGRTKELITDTENLSVAEKQEEFMFMGLRMAEGVSEEEFKKRFNCDIYDVYGNEICKLKNQRLIVSDDKRIYLTDRGIDVSNQVFENFIRSL